jgi:protein O-GlcNAc transferase
MTELRIEDRTVSAEEAFQHALGLLQGGRFAEMTDLCRKIVAAEPDHYRAHHGVGLGLHRTGQSPEALSHIRKALAINPTYFEAHLNLGNILRDLGRTEEALENYLHASELRPEAPLAHYNIANALSDLGRIDEALDRYSQAVGFDPAYFDGLIGRARALHMMKRFEEACEDYRKAIALRPEDCDAVYHLGITLTELGRHDEALELFRKAISMNPGKRDAHLALGNFLSARVDEGDPSGLDEAIACYRKVVSLNPGDGNTLARLANMLLVQGKVDEALHQYRLSTEQRPDLIEANSSYLMTLQYHPSPTLHELHEESTKWHRRFAAGVPKLTGHRNRRDPDRPLRIGYVSADFRRHPVGYHLMPVLYHRNAERYEVFCYFNNAHPDIYTNRLRGYADGWRDIAGMSDESVQDMILADGIDILVDLSGHTGGNRLLLFARKPAPVQVTWLGYFFSTGLTEIDYILMDDCAVLPGEERWFSEKVVRLPESRFCYEPVPYAPDVAPLPADRNGWVTFGSFNNLAKVTPQVVRLWSRVLASVPDSRLLLKSAAFEGAASLEYFQQQFAAEGTDPEQLILRGQSDHIDMLAEYGDIDIALDPFPFNGGVTSCEALWMGVPVLTLTGIRPIARQTTGFLRTIGLTDFIARTEDEYCALASRWAGELHELAAIRYGLRSKMINSLLCDGRSFTANLESAYRRMWRTWCAS